MHCTIYEDKCEDLIILYNTHLPYFQFLLLFDCTYLHFLLNQGVSYDYFPFLIPTLFS